MRLLLGKPADLNYFLGRIKNEIKENPRKKYCELVSARQSEEKNAATALDELNASTNLRELVALMQESIFIRTWRLEQINKSVYASLDLINKFAESIGTNYETLIYLTPMELQELEHSQENMEKYAERAETRRKGYAFVFDGSGTHIYTNKEMHEIQAALEEKVSEAAIISGQCASRGRAKGKVKIINDASELEKIEKGDVLVTQMTTPDFIVAMEKAVAIVTEIGGITCHAAIISRELGIPCIIGTNTATKTLKDGDFVEVNADEGKVKIIKSAG
jgi:phosphoenolpyruvate synthase/pyruvate phosphate dikinase